MNLVADRRQLETLARELHEERVRYSPGVRMTRAKATILLELILINFTVYR